jgi:hypothetical protein
MKDVLKKLKAHADKPASKAHKGLKAGGMPKALKESMMEKKMGKGMAKIMMQRKAGRGR